MFFWRIGPLGTDLAVVAARAGPAYAGSWTSNYPYRIRSPHRVAPLRFSRPSPSTSNYHVSPPLIHNCRLTAQPPKTRLEALARSEERLCLLVAP